MFIRDRIGANLVSSHSNNAAKTENKRLIVGLVQWLEYWVVTPVIGFESLAHPKLDLKVLDTDSKSISPKPRIPVRSRYCVLTEQFV